MRTVLLLILEYEFLLHVIMYDVFVQVHDEPVCWRK